MKTTQAQNRQIWIAKHCAALEMLAQTVGCQKSGAELLAGLRKIERKIYAACEQYSNESSYGAERWQAAKAQAFAEVAKLFGGKLPVGVYINSDPRGHSLKLDAEKTTIPEAMHHDWANDGILGPQEDEFA